jgi:hypothetical protein
VLLELGTERNHRVLQIPDDALPALREAGWQRNKLGYLFSRTIGSHTEVCPPKIDTARKLTLNRFAGHFSDHFASNQQKLPPHLQFGVVGLAHHF